MRGLRKQTRRWLWVVLIAIIVGAASAEVLQQETCYIAPDTVINGNLYVLCRDLQVEGRVNGNIIGAAYTATINGVVEDNLYLVGAKLTVGGTIGSDIHFAGVTFTMQPETQMTTGSLMMLGLSGTIAEGANVPGGVIALGYQLVMGGSVREDLDFWGSGLRIAGEVRGDVNATVGDAQSQEVAQQLETLLLPLQFNLDLINPGISVTDTGKIDGLLTYRAPIQTAFAGVLTQTPVFDPVLDTTLRIELGEEEANAQAFNVYLSYVIREITTLGLIGLLALLLIPEAVQRPIRTLRRQPVTSAGVGLLTFILSFPVVLIGLFLSLIIIVILSLLRLDGVIAASGILLGMVNIGGTSLFYFVAIYASRMVLAIGLGRLILHGFTSVNTPRSWYFSLLIGVVLLAIVASVPVIGWMVNALALFLGLGAILTVLQAQFRALRDEPLKSAPVYYPSSEPITITLPVPLLEATAGLPGMDNLPQGFNFDTWQD